MSDSCLDFFLGANTPNGFHSYFSSACPVADGWNVYIIKGGPGTGKSTLMKKLCSCADERGYAYERIYCSSDPDSLDGVIISGLHAAVFDGTAPHVIEPKYPGAYENIIDLGQAWSMAKLRSVRSEIISLSQKCSAHHSQATRFLACADAFRQNTALSAGDFIDRARILRTAEHLAEKYAGKGQNSAGSESIRLLSAVTPEGVRLFDHTLAASCDTIIPVRDSCYAPSELLFTTLRDILLSGGMRIITCKCSQSPGRIEHIIIPSLRTAFSLSGDMHPVQNATGRTVHTGRFLSADYISSSKQRLAFNRKNISCLTSLAAAEMRHAKSVHDELEQCYRQAMDFDAVDELADNACRIILR